ncbi:MAG: type II toxin-antitoxin system VapC family toxin [Holophagales bacterium]|nr:type II toxin-antitoxin system VapC family toxin [Holophagales bacterium]MYH25025.1 type II toxin-antitoxin system VapC family toxin [Holophagales bacterium]
MRAIDTNVVVRYLTGDDPQQAARARNVIETGSVFVSTTVLLECEWVLRSVYGLAGRDAATALRAFSGLPGVTVESPNLLVDALDRAAKGLDFADALHVGAAAHCEAMLTFDRSFVRTARGESPEVAEP